ncbi:Hypothetical protein D9617_8g050590 [Elsinoe fawcettii]|nr:Hypothetical protein D9617_8g050590 [Elsinoe fawcettii]
MAEIEAVNEAREAAMLNRSPWAQVMHPANHAQQFGIINQYPEPDPTSTVQIPNPTEIPDIRFQLVDGKNVYEFSEVYADVTELDGRFERSSDIITNHLGGGDEVGIRIEDTDSSTFDLYAAISTMLCADIEYKGKVPTNHELVKAYLLAVENKDGDTMAIITRHLYTKRVDKHLFNRVLIQKLFALEVQCKEHDEMLDFVMQWYAVHGDPAMVMQWSRWCPDLVIGATKYLMMMQKQVGAKKSWKALHLQVLEDAEKQLAAMKRAHAADEAEDTDNANE